MQERRKATAMRWVAGGLYLALAVYQMMAARTIIMNVGPSSSTFVWIIAVLVVPAAAVMCAYMFSSREGLRAGVQRAIVAGTAAYVVFEMVTYSAQTEVINYTLRVLMPTLSTDAGEGNRIWLYFFVIIRLLLVILAAFFASSSKAEKMYDGPMPEEEAAPVEEDDEETRAKKAEQAKKALEEKLEAPAAPEKTADAKATPAPAPKADAGAKLDEPVKAAPRPAGKPSSVLGSDGAMKKPAPKAEDKPE